MVNISTTPRGHDSYIRTCLAGHDVLRHGLAAFDVGGGTYSYGPSTGATVVSV